MRGAMYMNISGKQMVMFLTVIVPLMVLLGSLVVAPNIWLIMLAMIWLGFGLMVLYLPKVNE